VARRRLGPHWSPLRPSTARSSARPRCTHRLRRFPRNSCSRRESACRALLLQALGATTQTAALERLDVTLRDAAVVVPVSWVVDARLVSPRLDGWREDALGNVDYAAVRSRRRADAVTANRAEAIAGA